MRVAVATIDDKVNEHFGHSPAFTIAEVSNGKVHSRETVESPEHAPGRIPKFLKDQGVQAVVTCSMGQRAQTIFRNTGIECILGITGSIDEVLRRYAAGTLVSGENSCNHDHGHEHGHEHKHEHGHDHGHQHGDPHKNQS